MAKSKQKRNNVQRRLAQKRARQAGRGRSNHHCPETPLHFLPLATCQVNDNWREAGVAVVFLARRAGEGQIKAVCFLVDVWGVGVKDCFLVPCQRLPEALRWLTTYAEKVGMIFEECPEELAAQLVWGGIWNGKKAGFLPPEGFHRCKKLVPRISEDEWDPTLFGKDGQRLVIGELRDLQRRSRGKYDPHKTDGHFLIGGPVDNEDDSSPWQELLVEEDEGLPPDKERVFFIHGEYFLKDFHQAFDTLSSWDDLDLLETQTAEAFAEFSWTRPYPPNHWNPLSQLPGTRQNLGRLVLEGACLAVEVRGKRWMLIMDDRLHRAFGRAISRGQLRIQDPMELVGQSGDNCSGTAAAAD